LIAHGSGTERALTNCREFAACCADHGKLSYLSSPAQIEECETNNADLLVRARRAAANETSCVFSCADLKALEDVMAAIDSGLTINTLTGPTLVGSATGAAAGVAAGAETIGRESIMRLSGATRRHFLESAEKVQRWVNMSTSTNWKLSEEGEEEGGGGGRERRHGKQFSLFRQTGPTATAQGAKCSLAAEN
jgi:hypothetical protein